MSFRKSLDIGNSWELYIAGQLLANRCPIWYPRQTESECRGSFKGNQTDLLSFVEGRWQALEVKSRAETFIDIRHFPFPLIAVGSVEHWDSIKFQVYAVIVVSQITGNWGWVEYSKTRHLWQKRQLNDLAYCIPRSLFMPPYQLILRLSSSVQSLLDLFLPE